MAYVQFYIGDPVQYIKDPIFPVNDSVRGDNFIGEPAPRQKRDLHSIRILEAPSYRGEYVEIDVKRYNTTEKFVETDQASQDWLHRWYRLEFINDPSLPEEEQVRYVRTDPVVPEVMAEIIDATREWLGDTNCEKPAWPDQHYVQTIRFAVKQHRGERNQQFVDESDIVPIQLLVRQEFAQVIAYDHAKYYAMEAPAAKLDKSQIMAHYLEVSRELDRHYREIQRRLNMESGGYDEAGVINQMPSANVVDAARYSRGTGMRVKNIYPSNFRRRNYFHAHS